MRSVNKVILIGNVVRDPETKDANSGHTFTTFVLATNREWHSPDWSGQSLAEFHKVVAWWKLADLCGKFIKKWKFIYIEWYLKTRSWDQDWKKVYRTEVVAQDMIMLNKRGDWGEDFDWAEGYDEASFSDMESSWNESWGSAAKKDAPKEEIPEQPAKEETAEAPKEEVKEEKAKTNTDVDLDWEWI